MAHFGQSGDYVFTGYVTWIVCVKLLQDGIELIIIKEGLEVECRCQELRIVYVMISEIVHFVYYLLDLFWC